MKIIPLTALLLSVGASLFSQNLVGFSDSEIRKYMTENRKDMNFASTANSTYRYLKYSDSAESQTLLFFLDESSQCYSERLICDYSMKSRKLKEFDSMYRKTGNNSWVDTRGGKNYVIKLKDGQWSFTVTLEPEK